MIFWYWHLDCIKHNNLTQFEGGMMKGSTKDLLTTVKNESKTQMIEQTDSEDSIEFISLFSIPIRNCKMQQAIDSIIQYTKQGTSANFAFVNADCLNKVWSQAWYRIVLERMQEVYADGIGVKLAAKMEGVEIEDNVNGTDLFPLLCEEAVEQELKLFLLGARPGVVEQCAENMQKCFPGLIISGTQHGYFREYDVPKVIEQINHSGADIVIVAFGAPLQEFWVDHYQHEIHAPVCICVGGCFDFYSGRISRAPLWLRNLSMEWIWRLMQEPKRMWQRYIIGNPLFLYRAWKLAHFH
ncbi:MAG: WecB/TagA/CpsF family glycosyltransferase [Methylococcales bacterium]|nr:WecB/TagA/CpsF family glycosyltransferase [Methylococcales bacterium]